MNIEKIIYVIRGQKVMMDSDLAELYRVETKDLIRQVKRNLLRFPIDFMIELDFNDLQNLRRQFGTANSPRVWNHMRRTAPFCFTEAGVAMLSTVLNSEEAILINVAIIRTFIKLRNFQAIDNRDEKINKLFKAVFERLDQLEDEIYPKLNPSRRKIGLKDK